MLVLVGSPVRWQTEGIPALWTGGGRVARRGAWRRRPAGKGRLQGRQRNATTPASLSLRLGPWARRRRPVGGAAAGGSRCGAGARYGRDGAGVHVVSRLPSPRARCLRSASCASSSPRRAWRPPSPPLAQKDSGRVDRLAWPSVAVRVVRVVPAIYRGELRNLR